MNNLPMQKDDSKVGADLFSPNILEKISNQLCINQLKIRPLNSNDYDKGFLQLLAELTNVGNISQDQFLNRFFNMKNSGGYYVIVIEDLYSGKVVGSATLVVEQKFIHNCGLHGFLEDVIINNEYRGKQLGKIIVTTIKQVAKSLKCYKLTLNCQDRLIPFYESIGFKREPGNANSMQLRFSDIVK